MRRLDGITYSMDMSLSITDSMDMSPFLIESTLYELVMDSKAWQAAVHESDMTEGLN